MATIRPHAAIGILFHQGSLRVSLRVQYIVHARNDQSHDRRWLCSGRPLDSGPQLGLQSGGIGIDLRKLLLIAGPIEHHTLIEVSAHQFTHSRRIYFSRRLARMYSVPIALASDSS